MKLNTDDMIRNVARCTGCEHCKTFPVGENEDWKIKMCCRYPNTGKYCGVINICPKEQGIKETGKVRQK